MRSSLERNVVFEIDVEAFNICKSLEFWPSKLLKSSATSIQLAPPSKLCSHCTLSKELESESRETEIEVLSNSQIIIGEEISNGIILTYSW